MTMEVMGGKPAEIYKAVMVRQLNDYIIAIILPEGLINIKKKT